MGFWEINDEDEVLEDLSGECYLSFQKILRSELRIFDNKDSFILKHSLSLTRRQSIVG